MNFGMLVKALDVVVLVREAAKQFTTPSASPSRPRPSAPPAETGLEKTFPDTGLVGHLETRLTNVVVAALKEAFARDHARLELERAQMEEQRRRGEHAMRLELRRQETDRELGRLRLLAGTALVGFIAAVILLVARLDGATTLSRGIAGVGWLLLLGALGAAFSAQGRVNASSPDTGEALEAGPAGAAALWLLIAGLAVSSIGLLF